MTTPTRRRLAVPVMPDALSVAQVCLFLASHPAWLARQWNWKAAVMSSVVRGSLFFATNLRAGLEAAGAALLTEFLLRATTAGFYAATTQAFRTAAPQWAAVLAVSILLPVLTHSLELIVHVLRHTPALVSSIAVSAVVTIVSTQFNLYAMRRGALTVGAGSRPLRHDLRQVPELIFGFVTYVARGFSDVISCAIRWNAPPPPRSTPVRRVS